MANNHTDMDDPGYNWDQRFGGVVRLYGTACREKFPSARVLVVGIGGVGSWIAEALARAGIGTVGLMDADAVCVTNTNRQLHALAATVGQPKVRAMAMRLQEIHPEIRVEIMEEYFGTTTVHRLGSGQWDVIFDAIDSVPAKCLLLAQCREQGIRVVTSGGAGGRRDGTMIRVDDLARSIQDPLLRQTRKILRREFGFPRDERLPFGIQAVFSLERPVFPWADGSVCAAPEPESSLHLDCTSGFGTAAHVTGAFGLAAAGAALRLLADSTASPPHQTTQV